MGYSKKLNNSRLSEWKAWYIDYDSLCTKMDEEQQFFREFFNEVTKVNEFFRSAEKVIVEAKSGVVKENIKMEVKINSSSLERRSASEIPMAYPTSSSDSELTSETETASLAQNNKQSDSDYAKKLKEEFIRQVNRPLKARQESVEGKKEESNRRTQWTRKIAESRIFKDNTLIFRNNIFRKKYEMKSSERDYLDYIGALKHLISYRQLNLTGFKNILIRYDRVKKRNVMHILMPQVERCYFNVSRACDNLLKEVSERFKTIYHNENPERAMRIIRSVNRREKPNSIYTFVSGVILTTCFFVHLMLWADLKEKAFEFYCSIMAILVGVLLSAVSMVVFKLVKVNYNFIFGFVHGSKLETNVLITFCGFLILVHQITTFFLYEKLGSWLIMIYIGLLVFPVNIMFFASRFYLLSSLIKICLAPMFQVKFKHFFIADVLLSFAKSFKILLKIADVNSKLYYLIMWPTISRFMQCIRRGVDEGMRIHVYNACKYFCSFLCLFTNIYISNHKDGDNTILKCLEIFFLVISSIFSLCWDVFIDWSIFRQEYLFPIPFYPFVVVYDIIVRFLWISKFTNHEVSELYSLYLEVARRFLWLVIRVEQEHLNNCNKLSAVKFINIQTTDLFYRKDYQPLDTEVKTESESNHNQNEEDEIEV